MPSAWLDAHSSAQRQGELGGPAGERAARETIALDASQEQAKS